MLFGLTNLFSTSSESVKKWKISFFGGFLVLLLRVFDITGAIIERNLYYLRPISPLVNYNILFTLLFVFLVRWSMEWNVV